MAKKKKKTKRTRRKTTRRAPRARRGLAGVSVAALHAELNRRLETLLRKRDAVAAELEALDEEIAAYEGVAAPAPRRRAKAGRPAKKRVGRPAKKKKRAARPARRAAGGKRPRNKANLVDSLAKLLRNKTLSVTEMAAAVQKAGYKTSSPNFRTIVNQTLINNPKIFSRVARGQYTAK